MSGYEEYLKKFRERRAVHLRTHPGTADVWDHQQAIIDELRAARIAYASEFDGDTGSIHENIRKLKAQLLDHQEKIWALKGVVERTSI